MEVGLDVDGTNIFQILLDINSFLLLLSYFFSLKPTIRNAPASNTMDAGRTNSSTVKWSRFNQIV